MISSLLPVIYLSLAEPNSYTMGWNQGRAGFLFASAFLIFEYFDSRRFLIYQMSRWKVFSTLTVMLSAILYFTLAVFFGLQSRLWAWGESWGIPLLYSWVWLWDYLVFALYLILLILIFFNTKAFKRMLASVVYLFGMLLVLSLDALFPYDTLGPLQSVVPIILGIDVSLLNLIAPGSARAWGNVLTLQGRRGSFTITVYWPSAGVHSIIIYSLIMLIFLLKLDLSNRERAMFFLIGAIGTFFINIIRILLLSAYVVTVTTDMWKFEEFHSIAGDILFLPWIAAYLLLVSWYIMRGNAQTLGARVFRSLPHRPKVANT